MIKRLLFSVAVLATNFIIGQTPSVTFQDFPSVILTSDASLSGDDPFVLVIDNIPDDNTAITCNVRVYNEGKTGNADKLMQRGINVDATSDVEDTFYSFVESVGTNENTIKRTFTFTALPENTSGSGAGGNYVVGNKYDILVRLLNTGSGTVDINSNSIVPAVTMLGVATLSTENSSDVDVLSVYPNPTTGIINISDASDINTINVLNVLGQVVRVFEGNTTIDISDLKPGVYFLQANNGLKRKIVKK